MRFHGVAGDEELVLDVLDAAAFRQQHEHLRLACGKSGLFGHGGAAGFPAAGFALVARAVGLFFFGCFRVFDSSSETKAAGITSASSSTTLSSPRLAMGLKQSNPMLKGNESRSKTR